MTIFRENDEPVFECDSCGELLYDPNDCRSVDGCIICLECLREMSFCELMEITGFVSEDEIYDFLGLHTLRYIGEEENYE